MRSSQDLARDAPFSFQVHALNAEALEVQGRWEEAAAEYRKILEINPMLPGIHARLGRALLSKPQPSPAEVEEAKKNFEEELEIDPRNAGAEYVLGQLAADAGDFSTAIRHFTKATKVDVNFAEAYLGLGTSLNSAKRFTDAVPASGNLREDGARQSHRTLSTGARLRRGGTQRGREPRSRPAAPNRLRRWKL